MIDEGADGRVESGAQARSPSSRERVADWGIVAAYELMLTCRQAMRISTPSETRSKPAISSLATRRKFPSPARPTAKGAHRCR